MKKVAIEKSIPYTKGLLDERFDVRYLSDAEFISESISDCDSIIVRSTTKCDETLLRGTNVRFISTATAGFDHIDTDYCKKNNITWKNSEGCNKKSVAQYVVSSLGLVLGRDITKYKNMTLGIVGVGNTGGALLELANKLGLKTLLCDPFKSRTIKDFDFYPLDYVFDNSDIISFHVPLTKDGEYPTYHMINNRLLRRGTKGKLLINACRGAVMCTEDVVSAYDDGIISNLIIDCWENEPSIDLSLLERADISTPHIAGFSADSKRNATVIACNNVCESENLPHIKSDSIQLYEPKDKFIDFSSVGVEKDSQILDAIIRTTDLQNLTLNLKEQPDRFKEIRSNYVKPREFEAYTVIGAEKNNCSILKKIGFNIV